MAPAAATLDPYRGRVVGMTAAGTYSRMDIAKACDTTPAMLVNWATLRGVHLPKAKDGHPLDMHFDEIEQMIAAGDSAQMIGERFGHSKNTVIGWCGRRSVQLNDKASATQMHHARNRVRREPEIDLPAKVTALPGSGISLTTNAFPVPLDGVGVPFADSRANQCQRPLWGDEASTGNVCGHTIKVGSRYCEACHRLLWVPAATKLRAPRENTIVTNRPTRTEKHIEFAG